MSKADFLRSQLGLVVDLLGLVKASDPHRQEAIAQGCDPVLLLLTFSAKGGMEFKGDLGVSSKFRTTVNFYMESHPLSTHELRVGAGLSWSSGGGSVSESLAKVAAYSEAISKMAQVEAILNETVERYQYAYRYGSANQDVLLSVLKECSQLADAEQVKFREIYNAKQAAKAAKT